MAKGRKQIVQDLLKEAGYYWHDENEDNVKPINPEEYDPVVDKLFKANALELEKLYAEIEESQSEVVLNLSRSLVPDKSLFPEPGYTVAQINPKASRISASIVDHFRIVGSDDTGEHFEYYFTPMFAHEYPGCKLRAIFTDYQAIQVEKNLPKIMHDTSGGEGAKSVSNIWLGLDIAKVKEGDRISFFVGNKIVDAFDKNHFVFHAARWLLNGDPALELDVEVGIEAFDQERETVSRGLLDVIDVAYSHEKQVHSRLRNSFIHVSLPIEINESLQLLPPNMEDSAFAEAHQIRKPLCWIKLELPLAIPSDFLLKNTLYTNCIPLVNRKLEEKSVIKSNYDRILLPMPTTDSFLDVHQVRDTIGIESDSTYRRVDLLNPDSQPGTYTLRSGSSVRRLNREDASNRITRLMEIIHDEYSTFKEEGVNRLREDFDTIEKAINRVKKGLSTYFRDEKTNSSYFCIANFRPGAQSIRYEYWETQGDLIRHLGDKIILEVTSGDVSISDSLSIIPIQHGKGELSPDDYINQLKITLLSRGRILTKGDIELYCKSRFGKFLTVANISHEIMELEGGKRGRGILVTIKATTQLSFAEKELLRVELQTDLNARSAFFTFIKVQLQSKVAAT